MNTPTGFEYSITRARRKTMGIYIRNGRVEVRAPHHVRQDELHAWVAEKAGWIRQRLDEQHTFNQQKPDIRDGGCILFLGRERPLALSPGRPAVKECHDTLLISHQGNSSISSLLERWLKEEARLYLLDRVREIAETMAESRRITDIRFRKTRSKWGHCTSNGVLQFNWLIIMAPPEVIDYLIIHEISHLEHMNHSACFWQRVEQFCPDYKKRRQWLKEHGHRLWF